MKNTALTILFLICALQMFYAQEEDGVVALALPIRNSLTFNQFLINPTFSFVRQQHRYVSITNKREWVQFDDAPNTYVASYSGRFKENIGIGVAVFQQNYGVLNTFGGTLNFAYNARLQRDSNLTFGLNLGVYSSGIDQGRVVTNFDDPSLNAIPSNVLITVNPGINYGLAFLDFGVSIKNLALYNMTSSTLIEDNPEQSIQAHLMHTGYISSNGFLDESKFTGLLRSEFQKENTIISAMAMLTVPKGIWAQVGYNTLYGVSGGLGLNITKAIAIEYNFEKALGDLTNFGPSHGITLAYRLNGERRFDYSGNDEVGSIIPSTKKVKRPVSKIDKAQAEANRQVAQASRAQAKLDQEAKAKANAIAKENAVADKKLAAEAEAQENKQSIAEAEAEAKEDQENLRLAEEANAKQIAAIQAKMAAEAKARGEAIEAQRLAEAELKTKEAAAAAQAQLAAQEKIKRAEAVEAQEAQRIAQAEAQAKEEAARLKAAELQRLAQAETEAKAEAEAQARLATEAAARLKAAELQRIAQAETEAKAEAAAQARLAAEKTARLNAIEAQRLAQIEADTKAKQDAEAQLKANTPKDSNALPTASDDLGASMNAIAEATEASGKSQQALLDRLAEAVANKEKDLKDLKKENDLGDQGIFLEPKPFKSITAENNAIEALKADLDGAILARSKKIEELQRLYDERVKIATMQNDEVTLFYKKNIDKLKAEQLTALSTKESLSASLKTIKVATDIERKRRIKRAAYDSEQDRFIQDKNTLERLKNNTELSTVPLNAEDFDFGEEQTGNIQILKNVKNIDNGYYLILAVHTDIAKRDDFLRKAVASGITDIDFFYDVNTSKYFIYHQKYNSIEPANDALESKGSKPYNGNLSIVKIEN